MLWDLGLKVGHATRSLAECVRLAKQDITIRTAILEARYLWGDQKLYEELRKKFWTEVADRQRARILSKPSWPSATSATRGKAKAATWSSPTSRKAKAACATCRRSTGSANTSTTSTTRPTLVEHNVFTKEEYKTFQKAEAFLWDVRVRLHYLVGRAEERLSFDVQPELAASHGL